MNTFMLEFYKLKHKKIFLMTIMFILMELTFTFASVAKDLPKIAIDFKWEYTIMTITTMNVPFLSIFIAIIMSRLCDIEHKENMWKVMLSASVSKNSLYICKFLCCLSFVIFIVLAQVFSIVAFGSINNFQQATPIKLLLTYGIGTIMICTSVIAIQQWVSTIIHNQIFALTLGLLGSFVGLVCDLIPKSISRLFIWSYFSKLSPMTFHYSNDSVSFGHANISACSILFVFIIGILIYSLGKFRFSKKEI